MGALTKKRGSLMYNYDKELLAVENYPYPPLVDLRGKVYPSDYVDC